MRTLILPVDGPMGTMYRRSQATGRAVLTAESFIAMALERAEVAFALAGGARALWWDGEAEAFEAAQHAKLLFAPMRPHPWPLVVGTFDQIERDAKSDPWGKAAGWARLDAR